MGFFSWPARKGTVGETARVVGQQYSMLKNQNPGASDEDIFGTILAARHAAKSYTVAQLARLEASADYSESVGDFVLESDMRQAAAEAANTGEFIAHLAAIGVASSAVARLREDMDAGRIFVRELNDAINDELRKAFSNLDLPTPE